MGDRDQPMSQWPSTHRFVIPVADGPDEVTVTIDGKEVTAPRGELLIRVAQDHGTYIPRFCYHERMKPVGMCRMCLVEVEGMRGFQISCATPVSDGMVVRTTSDDVKRVQDGVLEFLLINHPLDCPVCDRGGECPLQDQTLAFGPGESRFVEEKRHFTKPIPISELVLLDRERCIQCGRCTRFASEIAGDPLIDFGGRGSSTEVITFPGDPFTSYFSGNIVQICPVGALTAKPYRFKARPWDLSSAETSCTTCAVGCRGALDSSSNRLLRLLGVDSEPINHGWLCDKGRFSYEHVHSWRRVRNPMVRKEGELVECSWPEALDAAAAGLRGALDTGGTASVALLGGARGTNEDAYLWAKLVKGVLGTDNVDAQLGDGLPAAAVLGLPGATIADCDTAAGIVLLAPDLKEELPVLSLRVKRAADDLGIPLVDISARDHGLSRYCGSTIRVTPGEQATAAHKLANAIGGAVTGDPQVDAAAELLRAGGPNPGGPIIVIVGRPSVAESADATVAAAAELLAVGDRVKYLPALRRGNVRGALELGLAPGFLPGRVALDQGQEWFAEQWGSVPATAGLGAAGVLAAATDGTDRRAGAPRSRRARRLPRPYARTGRSRRGAVRGRRGRVPHRDCRARRRVPADHRVGRAGRYHHQPRGPRAAPRSEGLARRHTDAGLADRRRARASLRRRLGPRARRGDPGRDRTRRARVRGRRRQPHPPRGRRCRPPESRPRGRHRAHPVAHPGHERVVGADPPRRRSTSRPRPATRPHPTMPNTPSPSSQPNRSTAAPRRCTSGTARSRPRPRPPATPTLCAWWRPMCSTTRVPRSPNPRR